MSGAGDLDRRIRLERAQASRDATGGALDEGWTPLATVWAARADLSDGERFQADERAAIRLTRFTVRSSSITRDLTPADRVFHDDAFYEITGIKEIKDGRNNYLELTTVVRNDWPDNA